MFSHDYTKEIGVESRDKVLSKPVALVILLIAGVAAWVGVRAILLNQPASTIHQTIKSR